MPRRCTRTDDLFEAAYPIRRPPHAPIRGASLVVRLKRALTLALKDCEKSREAVAAEMAEYLGEPSFSKAMLDAYTAESKKEKNISVTRLTAFVKATGATWVLDVIAEECGCHVLQSEEVRLAEIGRRVKQREQLENEIRALSSPLYVPKRRRHRRQQGD